MPQAHEAPLDLFNVYEIRQRLLNLIQVVVPVTCKHPIGRVRIEWLAFCQSLMALDFEL